MKLFLFSILTGCEVPVFRSNPKYKNPSLALSDETLVLKKNEM